MSNGFDVEVGICAIKVPGGWSGVAARNKFCGITRRTAAVALADAQKLLERPWLTIEATRVLNPDKA